MKFLKLDDQNRICDNATWYLICYATCYVNKLLDIIDWVIKKFNQMLIIKTLFLLKNDPLKIFDEIEWLFVLINFILFMLRIDLAILFWLYKKLNK